LTSSSLSEFPQSCLRCSRLGRTASAQATPSGEAHSRGSNTPAKEAQAPLEHRRRQDWRTRHNHGRGGCSSRANRTACKAARSGASVWARAASQPEAETDEQPGFNGANVQIRWSNERALLKVDADQQAVFTGVHGLGAANTFEVDTCGGNLCARTTTHRGIITLGDACSSAHPRFEHTDIGGKVGEGEKAHTVGIIGTDNPDTRGEADVESGVIVTEPATAVSARPTPAPRPARARTCTAWPTTSSAQSSTSAPPSIEELGTEGPSTFGVGSSGDSIS
jgi:hypothetical protein